MRLALVLAVLLVACDSAPSDSAPSAESAIAGPYEAVRYITPAPYDGPVDQLALGGRMILRLNPDGTYTGQERRATILVGPGEDGVAFRDVELAGTYRLQADTLVRFTRSGDDGLPVSQLRYDARTGVLADSIRGIGPFVLVLAPRGRLRPASSARPR